MRPSLASIFLVAVGFGQGAVASCTSDDKIAGMKQEIKTIRSHSVADAEAIPYAPEAYRVFTITYVDCY